MKICLLFPPHWTPTMPHLALPWLTGCLRQNGHTVVQRDLNIEVFDEILTQPYLRRSIECIQQRRPHSPDSQNKSHPAVPPPLFDIPHDQWHWALEQGPSVADKVEKAKGIIRSPQFYDGETSLPAFITIVEALELASLAFYPARLELGGFSDPLRPDASRDLLETASNPDTNPFYEIFQRGILPDLQRNPPDLVGLSIPTQGQFLASLTLARLIRQAGLKCHITAGGPHVTMLREQLPTVPALFDWFDSFILFDGELPLLRLAETLDSRSDLSTVPNLIFRQTNSSQIQTTPLLPVAEVQRAQQNICPDFEGLSLGCYLTPQPVLPLVTTHGCYHAKCGFCNVGYGGSPYYFSYPIEKIVQQVRLVQEQYHCQHIFFVDEAIPPRILKQLATALKDLPAPINWCGAVRFDKALSDSLLSDLSDSGCRMLLFGLESAAEPVMQRMLKGIQHQEMSRILNSAAAAGIWNHIFFFFGFPGETMDDAQKTVDFVYAHQNTVHSASPGAFLLERYAPAYRHPEKFGIRRIQEDPKRDLAIYFDYEAAQGIDEEAANLLADRFIEQLPDKRFGQYYNNDIYRLLYASYLHRQGRPMPRWIE